MATIKVAPKRRPKVIVYEAAIPYSQLSPEDQAQFDAHFAAPDPYAVLRAKTIHLAELLHCSEAEAERLILDRVGHY
jgi:hypothetical protein